MPGGQFWYGKYGFLYKRSTGGGGLHRLPVVNCSPTTLWNTYVYGSGVGGISTANRRAQWTRAMAHRSQCK